MSGSDTDGSDSEAISEKSLYTRVRLEALQCLHCLAVSNAQLLHTSWLGLLPVYSVESRSPRDATLVDIILKDPVVKVSQFWTLAESPSCSYSHGRCLTRVLGGANDQALQPFRAGLAPCPARSRM